MLILSKFFVCVCLPSPSTGEQSSSRKHVTLNPKLRTNAIGSEAHHKQLDKSIRAIYKKYIVIYKKYMESCHG
jgi:hypothetical protein